MIRFISFIIGFLILLTSCQFNFTANGSIHIETSKDSVDILLNNVQEIVNNMDHDLIKKEVSNKFPNFSNESIESSYIKFTKMWSTNKEDYEADLFIRTYISCNPKSSSEVMEVIEYYESFIIEELEKNNIIVKQKDK